MPPTGGGGTWRGDVAWGKGEAGEVARGGPEGGGGWHGGRRRGAEGDAVSNIYVSRTSSG